MFMRVISQDRTSDEYDGSLPELLEMSICLWFCFKGVSCLLEAASGARVVNLYLIIGSVEQRLSDRELQYQVCIRRAGRRNNRWYHGITKRDEARADHVRLRPWLFRYKLGKGGDGILRVDVGSDIIDSGWMDGCPSSQPEAGERLGT